MVSVIVPVYNVEAWLSRCIESILSQTYTDFELILVDDGSRDTSGNICDNYAQTDSRIRVFHEKNGGVSNARNKGLNVATGEYIYFADSDDFLKPDLLAVAVSQIKQNTECVCFGYSVISEFGMQEITSQVLGKIDLCKHEDKEHFIHEMLMHRIGWEVWNKLFLRKVIEQNNIRFDPDINYAEDQLFCISYFMSITKAVSISDSLYCYNKREGSIMSTQSTVNNITTIALTSQKFFDFCKLHQNSEWIIDRFPLINYLLIRNEIQKLENILQMNRKQIRAEMMHDIENTDFLIDQFKQLKKHRNKLNKQLGTYRAARELSDVVYYLDGKYFDSRVRNRLILIHKKVWGKKQNV